MVRLLVQLLVTAMGLYLAAQVVPGVDFDGLTSLLLAAVLLGVVNAVVRPILVVLTFPITVLTLGLFLLIVNAAMIGLVSVFLAGFAVDGLWAGVRAALVTGIVSWVADALLGDRGRRS